MTDVLIELLRGGPQFERCVQRIEEASNLAITPLTLSALVRGVRQHHEINVSEAVAIVERLINEIGATIVPISYEMAIASAAVYGRQVQGDVFSMDDAFAFAAAQSLKTEVFGLFDLAIVDFHNDTFGWQGAGPTDPSNADEGEEGPQD